MVVEAKKELIFGWWRHHVALGDTNSRVVVFCRCMWRRTTATVLSFDWQRVVGRAAGLRSATGRRYWCPVPRSASSVSRWSWAAAAAVRSAAAGAPETAFCTVRRAGRPSQCPDVAASGLWRRRMRHAAVPQTTSTASYSSERGEQHLHTSSIRITRSFLSLKFSLEIKSKN